MQSYLRSLSSTTHVNGLNLSTVAHTTSVVRRQNVTSTRLPTELISYDALTAIGTVLTALFIFGLLENISVLLIYNRNKNLQGVANYWICAILMCDLLLVSTAIPYTAASSFMGRNLFGSIGCQYDGFNVTVLGTTSIFLFTGLSVHRHYIMMGTKTCQTIRKFTVVKYILACFLFGLFWGICPLLGWGTFALEGVGISCAPNWKSKAARDVSYTVAMYIFVLFIPLIIIGYCYSKILFKVWRETRMQSEWIQRRRVRRDIRVTISVAFTLLSFIICWTPYAVVSFLEAFCDADLLSISPMLVQFPCLVAKAACIWNPLVYICHNSQCRKAFLEMYRCIKKDQLRNVQLTSGSDSQTIDNKGRNSVLTPIARNKSNRHKYNTSKEQHRANKVTMESTNTRNTLVMLNSSNNDTPSQSDVHLISSVV